MLAQKILDARLALMRLRQAHPHPRLTIPMANQKLADQVTEMQELSDEVEAKKKEVKTVKEKVKVGALEVEKLRIQQAESERAVESLNLEEDDNRLVPLYDWYVSTLHLLQSSSLEYDRRYTASLNLHHSIFNLEESHSESENELRLVYRVEGSDSDSPPEPPSTQVTIVLIFAPDTRELAGVETAGFEEMGVETDDIVDAHIMTNDVSGLIAILLARARVAVTLL